MFSCYSSEAAAAAADISSHHIDLKPKKHHSSKTNHHHSHSQNRFITGNVLNTDPHLGATNGSGFVPNLSSKKTTSERDFERIRLKQEQERRYKLCAEHEKSLRERTNRQSSLKQSQNNDALKKFYENKAREFGLMNCTRNQQSSKAPSFSKNLPENSEPSLQIRSTPKKNDSRSARDLVERIKSGYKIVKFIKYHITRLKTQRILSKLCKLRTFENHLISLKSTNNNDINSLKDPILKILEQLDQISSGDSEVVIARKNQIVKMAQNMMGSLNEKCLNINYSLDVY